MGLMKMGMVAIGMGTQILAAHCFLRHYYWLGRDWRRASIAILRRKQKLKGVQYYAIASLCNNATIIDSDRAMCVRGGESGKDGVAVQCP